MLLFNMNVDNNLVNGSTGEVIGFDSADYPVVKFVNCKYGPQIVTVTEHVWEMKLGKKVVARRRQIPLLLSWAITVHKSQGMSIENVEVSLNGMFERGQIYTALSRACTLQGLRITGRVETKDIFRPDQRVIKFFEEECTKTKKY